MQDEVGHLPSPSLRSWHRPMTLYVNNKNLQQSWFFT